MPVDMSAAHGAKLEQESLLPELLHALNQPLTSLRCSLEVTLLQPRDSDEYRRRLRESLKLTEDITVLASGIRELIDVEQPNAPPRAVSLDKILQFSTRELMPLADAEGVGISVLCTPSLTVLGDEKQLSTAIIYLLSFLLNRSSRGGEVNVQAKRDGEEIALAFELSESVTQGSGSKPPAQPGAARAYLRLLVARRIFEVAGGTVRVDLDSKRGSIRIRLPRLRATEENTASPMKGEMAEPKGVSRVFPFRKVLPR
jgi:two-component system, OmpR family, sensor histidine kinase VanS